MREQNSLATTVPHGTKHNGEPQWLPVDCCDAA